MLMVNFSAAGNDRTITINYDPGGEINTYIIDIIRSKANGVKKVVIDGMCASACLFWLHKDFGLEYCATERAMIGWHDPYYQLSNGTVVISREDALEGKLTSRQVIAGMPEKLKLYWKDVKFPSPSSGDSTSNLVWVSGKQAVELIGACDENRDLESRPYP